MAADGWKGLKGLVGQARSQVAAIVSNPWVGALSILTTLIGLPLAIYFWYESRVRPDLAFYVHPVRATVVSAGRVSRLRVSYDRQDLATDVNIAQMAIWNAGKRSIREADVLERIEIFAEPVVPVLEATVTKVSRNVTNFRILDEHFKDGVISLSWRILENGDGAILQIVYAGSPEAAFKIRGTIEGQREIRQFGMGSPVMSEKEYRTQRTIFKVVWPLLIVVGILQIGMIISIWLGIRRRWKENEGTSGQPRSTLDKVHSLLEEARTIRREAAERLTSAGTEDDRKGLVDRLEKSSNSEGRLEALLEEIESRETERRGLLQSIDRWDKRWFVGLIILFLLLAILVALGPWYQPEAFGPPFRL